MRRFAAGVAVLFAALGLLASPAGAGMHLNTIEDEALLGANGHKLDATLLIGCTEGERVRLRVTVTQGHTVGVGHAAGQCSGDVQEFPVRVAGTGGDVFTEGAAEADAWAKTKHGQHTHPAHEWNKTITLVT